MFNSIKITSLLYNQVNESAAELDMSSTDNDQETVDILVRLTDSINYCH